MNRGPQFSLFFCEDFRMEIGYKPMIIGVLSPVIFMSAGDPEDANDTFNLVTSFMLPADMSEIDLSLQVKITRPDMEIEERSFRTSIERDVDADPAEPWSALIPLPLDVANCLPGTRIEGDLSTKCGGAWTSLLVQVLDERAAGSTVSRSRPAAKKKPARKG